MCATGWWWVVAGCQALPRSPNTRALSSQWVGKDRGDGWTNLLLSCDTHSAASCHGKSASLVAEDITRILNVADGA